MSYSTQHWDNMRTRAIKGNHKKNLELIAKIQDNPKSAMFFIGPLAQKYANAVNEPGLTTPERDTATLEAMLVHIEHIGFIGSRKPA